MVVTKDGVEGSFLDLERAKEVLKELDVQEKDKRFIAEVGIDGKLIDDPSIIDGEAQLQPNFNSYFGGDKFFRQLMDFCEKYLQATNGAYQIRNSFRIISSLIYISNNYITNKCILFLILF